MQYHYCPRCKFRMGAIKKHICPTCGHKLPRTTSTTGSADGEMTSRPTEHQATMPRLWSKLFKWEFSSNDADSIESTQEKPVLG